MQDAEQLVKKYSSLYSRELKARTELTKAKNEFKDIISDAAKLDSELDKITTEVKKKLKDVGLSTNEAPNSIKQLWETGKAEKNITSFYKEALNK